MENFIFHSFPVFAFIMNQKTRFSFWENLNARVPTPERLSWSSSVSQIKIGAAAALTAFLLYCEIDFFLPFEKNRSANATKGLTYEKNQCWILCCYILRNAETLLAKLRPPILYVGIFWHLRQMPYRRLGGTTMGQAWV